MQLLMEHIDGNLEFYFHGVVGIRMIKLGALGPYQLQRTIKACGLSHNMHLQNWKIFNCCLNI